MLTEFKRIKHGELPGDISRRAKIRMREIGDRFDVWPWQTISENCANTFRRFLQDKSKSRQRRRDKQAIFDGLKESGDV